MKRIFGLQHIVNLFSPSLVTLLVLVSALFLSTGTTAFASSTTSLAGRKIVPGHLIPALHNHTPTGDANKAETVTLSIALNLRDEAGLKALIAAQNDPNSPLYQHYLTPAEFTARFAPTQATVDQVTAYLQNQNLHVTSISSNRLLINASGTRSNVEKAFNVNIANYALDSRSVYAPTSEPSVPDALGGIILNIGGLDNVAHYHHYTSQKTQAPQSSLNPAQPATGPGGGFTPSELRTAYDINSLISNGDTGSGQTVAIFELDGYKASDVNAYLSNYSLGSAHYSNVLVDGATNTAGSGAIEVELDMEVVSAIAPDATQKIYIGPNTTTGVNDTYNKIVTDNTAKVTSISWGECESSSGNSELQALDNIFSQGASQGQAFFSASGDSGAYDCGGTTLGVDSPAGDPYVVGVGGTKLLVGTGGTYSSESAWSNTSNSSGGGGGISSYFSRPSYQTGTNLTNANREVPDVSADADPASGYSVYCTVTAAGCSSSGWISVGGTSAAAPLWAGIAADVNQYLSGLSKPVLGSASSKLYTLYNTAQTYTPYHDVTTGNNLYYSATANYDLATGVGTPDAWNIARDLGGSSGGGGGGGTTTQLLANPGFESGSTSWQESSSGGYEIVDTTRPHTGTKSAYLCGYNSCNDQIWQTVSLPSTTTKVVLTYWTYISTNESGSTCYDYFYARIRTSGGSNITTAQTQCNANTHGWTQYTYDLTSALSSYKGSSVQVYFQATTDSSLTSNFFLDDVAFNVTA